MLNISTLDMFTKITRPILLNLIIMMNLQIIKKEKKIFQITLIMIISNLKKFIND